MFGNGNSLPSNLDLSSKTVWTEILFYGNVGVKVRNHLLTEHPFSRSALSPLSSVLCKAGDTDAIE